MRESRDISPPLTRWIRGIGSAVMARHRSPITKSPISTPEHCPPNRYPLCGSGWFGSYISNAIETSDGQVFAVVGPSGGGGFLMKYYPTVAIATTSVEKVLASVAAGNEVVVSGLNETGQNETAVYHPATDTETQVIGPENEIEMYHLTYVPNGNSVMFEGLRFSDNRVVLGQIDLDTGEVTVSASLPRKLQDLQAFH